MELRYAFAVSEDHRLIDEDFGNADTFLIYGFKEGEMRLISEEPNGFKHMKRKTEQEARQKGDALIAYLRGKGVTTLVSKRYCKNIHRINQYFIPVIVSPGQHPEVVRLLQKHAHWIQEEWESRGSGFHQLTIRSGILKSALPDPT